MAKFLRLIALIWRKSSQSAPDLVTVSIDFACCPRAETNVEHLLQRANDALYAAKVAGRSCSVFYQRLGDEADRLGARLASQSCNSPKLRRCFALI